MTIKTSRRTFLKGAAAAGGVLLVGVGPDGAVAAGRAAMLNPFVKIDANGTVTVIVKHIEKGQGTATGLATLVAEELGMRDGSDRIRFRAVGSRDLQQPRVRSVSGHGRLHRHGQFLHAVPQGRRRGARDADRSRCPGMGRCRLGLRIEDGLVTGAGVSEPLAPLSPPPRGWTPRRSRPGSRLPNSA